MDGVLLAQRGHLARQRLDLRQQLQMLMLVNGMQAVWSGSYSGLYVCN